MRLTDKGFFSNTFKKIDKTTSYWWFNEYILYIWMSFSVVENLSQSFTAVNTINNLLKFLWQYQEIKDNVEKLGQNCTVIYNTVILKMGYFQKCPV